MPHSPLLKIYFNTILPTTPRPAKWWLSLRFPHQNLVYSSSLTHFCYLSRQSHFSWFDSPYNRPVWWTVQIMKLLIMQSSPLPCYLVSLRLISSSSLYFATPSGAFVFCNRHGVPVLRGTSWVRVCVCVCARARACTRIYIYIIKVDRNIWRFNLLKPTGYVMHYQV
jgi:hypothetical protein